MAAEKGKPTKATSPLVEEKTEELCFVIMPFSGYFNDYYSSIYSPAIQDANLIPHRADDLYRPSQIINDIWSYTQISKLILADLSGKNPNVFYELGLAHALAKPAILITESIDDVPFDLRALRVLEYDKNQPRWGDVLQENITSAIKEIIKSPLEAVLPTFLSVDNESKQDSISKDDKFILEMRRDIEFLRNEVAQFRSFNKNSYSLQQQLTQPEALRKTKEMLDMGLSIDRMTDILQFYGVSSYEVTNLITQVEMQRRFEKNK